MFPSNFTLFTPQLFRRKILLVHYNGVWRNIFVYYAASSYDDMIAYDNTLQYDDVGAYPTVPSNCYGRMSKALFTDGLGKVFVTVVMIVYLHSFTKDGVLANGNRIKTCY